MTIPVELTIVVSDEEKSYTSKDLIYGSVTLSHDDVELNRRAEEAKKEFAGSDDPKIIIKTKMVWS